MPPTRSEFDRDMQVLEAELKRLEAEYSMFFAGRLPRLPYDQRTRVDAMMKRLDRSSMQNTGDRFRFGALQSRFAAFCELWERQLRAQEEGRSRLGVRGRIAPVPASFPVEPPPGPAPVPDAPPRVRDHVVSVASFTDPASESDRVQELYERLSEARREVGDQPVAFERFQALVISQVSKLGAGQEVAFRVAVKNGKVTLTAKPVKGDEP